MLPPPIRFAGLGLALALGVVTSAFSEPRLIRSGADVTIPLSQISGLTPETHLAVLGVRGTLSIRQGTAASIRYRVRDLANPREARPLDLVQDGEHLRIEAGDGTGAGPLLFELECAPGMALVLEIAGSKLDITNLSGRFELRARDSSIVGSNLTGPVRLTLDGGQLEVEGVRKQLEIEGDGLEARLVDLEGSVRLGLHDSRVELESVAGILVADVRATRLGLGKIRGEARVTARDGGLRVRELTGEAELDLNGTFLALDDLDAVVRVRTDAQVQFGNVAGALTIDSQKNRVRGTGSSAELIIRGEGTTVELTDMTGRARLEGSDMKLQVLNSKAEVTIDTTASPIEIYGASGSLRIHNLGGDVRITQQHGPLEIQASCTRVEVDWGSMPAQDSTIENTAGQVQIVFPPAGGCQVEVESLSGKVETNIDGILVSEDGARASGSVGSPLEATRVRVVASGDVSLRSARTSR